MRVGNCRFDAVVRICALVTAFLGAGCRTHHLRDLQQPQHLRLSQPACARVSETSRPEDIERFVNFLANRKDGWDHWRITYFGVFQNARPYATIHAADARSNVLYSVGINRKQITFWNRGIKLRRKTNQAEHDQLLGIMAASDRLFAEISRGIGETFLRMEPVAKALEQFRKGVGRCPTNEEGIDALIHNPGSTRWNGPYAESIPVDAWGTPFKFYTVRIKTGGDDILSEHVWSAGHDRRFDFAKPGLWKGNDLYCTLDVLRDRMLTRKIRPECK